MPCVCVRQSKHDEALMRNLRIYPRHTFRCIKFCNDPKLLDKFRESAKLLDMVQKGLSDYLETKRAGFSRFYFLSNDELLEILSQTKVGNNCLLHARWALTTLACSRG